MHDLPGYDLAETLHESRAAVIRRGRRREDGAVVAVKLLKSEQPSSLDVAMLRHEAAITRDLDAPGVAAAHGVEERGATLALVMGDLPGAPLADVLRAGPLDLASALRLASALAETLAGLHKSRVIHKDVTPSNVFVDRETGAVRLLNFGFATRLSQETQRAKNPDTLDGTLAYMSPEQTGRMNRALDHRTDLYALGVTLYEALVGAVPFSAADPMELVHSHIARRATPPRELRPEIPEVVSDLVMKLLSKAAEDRYQSALGLKADLDECLARLTASGAIAPFALGRHDRPDELRVPQKLYGREREIEALLRAFDRAADGEALLLLVTGSSGVGKSALVHEIHKPIARGGGHFIAGKFDQLGRAVPYAAVAHAFRELLRSVITGSEATLARYRRRLRAAVENSGQLLVDLIPELELVIGPQPRVPEVGPTESQNRFALVFQRFLQVFATREHPLVVFLDDLQWADPASLKLLDVLLTDPGGGHLLVIGAYRENEVDAAHPLARLLAELKEGGTIPSEIVVAPLAAPDVERLVADALECGAERAAPLARVVFEKTHGNPFFLGQFLKELSQDRVVAYDAAEGAFRWDLQRVREALATDNVVAFMVGKIQKLSPTAQRLLELAACIGNRFELQALALLHDKTPLETAADLREPIDEGLLLAVDPEARFFHPERGRPAARAAAALDFRVSYRFLHDRVQQAAASLLDGRTKQELHLRIGRSMRTHRRGDEALFDVVHHLNLGAALIDDPAERAALARQNLDAGRRARAATAYQAAAAYFGAGVAMLSPTCWEDEYELAFELHVAEAECAYMSGALERAESLFEALLRRARRRLEKARVHNLRIDFFNTAARFVDAMDVGREALSLFDIAVPDGPAATKAALAAELAEVEVNLGGRPIGDLVHAPAMTDPEQRAVLKLLQCLSPCSYTIDQELYAFVAIKQVNLSLKHGSSEVSAYGYMQYAVLLVGVLGRYARGYEFGRLALDLNERFENLEIKGKVNENFAAHVSYFRRPLRESLRYFKIAHEAGLESGDLIYLSYGALHALLVRLGLGEELGLAREEVDRSLALMRRTKDAFSTSILIIGRQMIANLTGRTKHRGSLCDDALDEAALEATVKGARSSLADHWYYTVKLWLAVLYEDDEAAASLVALAEEGSAIAVAYYSTTELAFYACLALLGAPPARDEASAQERAAKLARYKAQLAAWAESCPENFLHRHLLVLAEEARLAARELDAMALFDRAIEAARASGLVHHEALANERCARLHLAAGRTKIGRMYLADARYGYLRWGAVAKAEHLQERYPQLLADGAGSPASAGSPAGLPAATGKQLDAMTVLKASQVLSGEIAFEKLLARLMSIVMENAGAERGALLLEQEGELRAAAEVSAEALTVLQTPAAIDEHPGISPGIVKYAARTQQSVILGDAANEGAFTEDAYVVGRRPKSVLCMPLLHQGAVKGVLYLENNLATGAFTPGRAELLSALCAQMAISIENATLYAGLEKKVAERTRELRAAQAQLVRLEKEATEVQMAGGFAHEMRNALAAARMMIAKAYPSGAIAPGASLCVENSDALRDLFVRVRDRVPAGELTEIARSLRKVNNNEQQLDDVLASVDVALGRALAITRMILEYARLSQERPGREPVPLRPLVASIVAELEPMLAAHRISCEIDVPPERAICATPIHLDSILRNLVQNACDAISEATGDGRRALRVESAESPERVVVRVSDTGVGIRPEDRGRIFEAFFSTKPATGTGLGLGMVQRLVNLYGGTIAFESEVGRGTTFEVAFPRDEP